MLSDAVNTETHSGTGMAITDAAHRASDDEQSQIIAMRLCTRWPIPPHDRGVTAGRVDPGFRLCRAGWVQVRSAIWMLSERLVSAWVSMDPTRRIAMDVLSVGMTVSRLA